MKLIFGHFESSIGLVKNYETLYERSKLFALTEDYDRALEDLRAAAALAPWDYKIR